MLIPPLPHPHASRSSGDSRRSSSTCPYSSLAGFLIIIAFYYFAGTRALWGRTIGGAIFDVRAARSGMTFDVRK